MTEQSSPQYVHLIARVDRSNQIGQILYVNPSKAVSSLSSSAANESESFVLVLRSSDGAVLGQVVPEVRYGMCNDGLEAQSGLIQQDVRIPEGTASIDLLYEGKVLDSFRQPASEGDAEVAGVIPDLSVNAGGRGFNVAMSGQSPTDDSTYTIQAKPEGDDFWQTLSVGRKSPDFELDKNQFPGADRVKLRVVKVRGFQNVGTTEKVVDLR